MWFGVEALDVLDELVAPAEGCGAVVAAVGLVLEVGEDVPLELLLGGQQLVAEVAEVGHLQLLALRLGLALGVRVEVALELVRPHKALPADGADVGLDPRVDGHVAAELSPLQEPLLADFAAERALGVTGAKALPCTCLLTAPVRRVHTDNHRLRLLALLRVHR